MGVLGQLARCLADVWMKPWHCPYCCDLLKGIFVCLCACVNNTEKERARGQGQDMLSPPLSLLFTMHGGLSRIGCRQRGSKLIIQCAGNMSKASAGRLETRKASSSGSS